MAFMNYITKKKKKKKTDIIFLFKKCISIIEQISHS